MGFSAKQSVLDHDFNNLKIPDRCPFCGDMLLKNSGASFGGCPACSSVQESMTDQIAESILDFSSPLGDRDKYTRANRKNSRKPKLRQKTFSLSAKSDSKVHSLRFSKVFSGLLGMICGSLISFLMTLIKPYNLFPPFVSTSVMFPEAIYVTNVEYFKSNGKSVIEFGVTNDYFFPVVDISILVGFFDKDSNLLKADEIRLRDLTKSNRSSKIKSPTSKLLDALEAKSFKYISDIDAARIAVLPVQAKFLM